MCKGSSFSNKFFQQVFTNTWCLLSFFMIVGMRYLIVILIHTFLMLETLTISSYTCWPFACLLWRNIYSIIKSIFKKWIISLCVCVQLLSCRSSMYLEINPLSNIWFANIFSYSVDCLSPC